MESLLVEEEVLSSQTVITAQKGHNFLSDRLITLKIFLRFPKAFFVGVVEELLSSDKDVWSATLSIGSKGP